jgi:hypothetical protein
MAKRKPSMTNRLRRQHDAAPAPVDPLPDAGADEPAAATPFPTKGRSAPVSFRCSPELFDALTAAATRRKPARQHPYTQQDILCQALAEWLARNASWPPQ